MKGAGDGESSSKSKEFVVFSIIRDSTCAECGEELGRPRSWNPDHAAIANHRRISARGTTPVRSAMIIPRRKSTKYGID
jgi:hypothetical protein